MLTRSEIPLGMAPARLTRAAAVSAVVLGGIVLTGWALDLARLQNLWPRSPSLPANSAALLILLGVALGSVREDSRRGPYPRLRYQLGQIAALLAAGVGLATLLEYVLGWKMGLDEWLFHDRLAAARHAIPGRPSFPTALNAICLGTGLALLDVPLRRVWPSQALAVMSVLIAFLALIGHLCNVPEFYGQAGAYGGTFMAVPEAVGFFLLGFGLLCARAERGLTVVLWSQTPGGMLARWLILAPAVGLLLTGVVYLALDRGMHLDHAIRTWALGLSNIIFVTVPIWAAAHALHQVGLERDQAHHALEERVQQRTAELTQANSALRAEIAERGEIEKALREARDRLENQAVELEARVAERTARLSETIGELEAFSYSVAHDMRAPLRGMQGFSRLLLEDHASHLDAEGRNYLERISSSAVRMDLLIQDVLNYTRVLRTDTSLTPIDLDQLVRHLVAIYPDWQPPRVQIEVQGRLPSALGHEGFLTQCVSNLVGNAVKFVAPGVKPSVRIWAQSLESQVRVWVEDNGIGIAPKDHDRIFRMFERVNHSDKYEGTGIGLAIVRKAVERMGGRVDFESEPGQGSRFWLELRKAPPT